MIFIIDSVEAIDVKKKDQLSLISNLKAHPNGLDPSAL